jgi:hypothetical protein
MDRAIESRQGGSFKIKINIKFKTVAWNPQSSILGQKWHADMALLDNFRRTV